MGWWFFTRSAVEALTTPADVEACDRSVTELTRESRLAGFIDACSRGAQRAWMHSSTRMGVRALRDALTPDSGAATIRIRGWVAVVTGLTILVLNALKPVPVAPMTALVPVLIVVAGALCMVTAAPLARAAADRRSRLRADKAASR